MNQTIRILYPTLLVVMFCFAVSITAPAAVVHTKHGPREGQVIVREFEHIVITILTPDKRLFQFYDQDVEKVTAPEKILLATATQLYKEPAEDAEKVIELARGLQVNIQSTSEDKQWVEITCWGDHEGWIKQDQLTDEVIFTKGLKSITPSTTTPSTEKIKSPTSTIITPGYRETPSDAPKPEKTDNEGQ